MALVKFYLFGYPRILLDGSPVEVDTRKAVALLAYLSVNKKAYARDILAGLLWPEYDQSGARAALRRTLSVLNRATGGTLLMIEREQVDIHPGANFWLDVSAFEARLGKAEALRRAGQPYIEDLIEAVSFHRDRFMAGFSLRDSAEFDDWQFFQAERLSRLLAAALETLAYAYEQRQDFPAALERARQWLAIDPLLEEAHRLLIRLYARSGQRSLALHQYRECVRIFEQELSVTPLPETTALYQEVLENRIGTDEIIPAVPAAGISSEMGTPEQKSFPHNQTMPLLVGRSKEMQQLQDLHRQMKTGHFVLLEGEAGIGKTRLAAEFLNRAVDLGAQTMSLRFYEGESGLAYGPFVSAIEALTSPNIHTLQYARLAKLPPAVIAETARLVSGLTSLVPEDFVFPPSEGPGAQTRFFEALRVMIMSLLEGRPAGIIFFDDLQWADTASLDLLSYLVRRLENSPILVVGTLRSDLPVDLPRLVQIIHDAQRLGVFRRITLGRLTQADLANLVQDFAISQTMPPDFTGHLFTESEGLPFFAVEYLQSAIKSGNWNLPASVRDVLLYRLASVTETARQLLSSAAVIGRTFDLDLLREVSGRSELETISGLETLIARGLVVEQPSGSGTISIGYDFTHEKLRSLVYEETSLARRRLLHRRVAESLSGPLGRREGAPASALIANHYHLSGDQALAAAYYRLAGDQARAVFAHEDAALHYASALAAHHPEPALLHESLGDVQTLLGNYRAALSSYETAASLTASDDIVRLEHKLGSVHARLGQWDLAETYYQAAVEGKYGCQGSVCAGILADWSQAAEHSGNSVLARALAGQALAAAKNDDDEAALAQAYNISGILSRRVGEYHRAEADLLQAQQITSGTNMPGMEIAVLNNLALLYADMDRLDESILLEQKALEKSWHLGDRHREAALLSNLADLLHRAGREEESMAYLKRAVMIFTEIGGNSDVLNPEIWKLTEW